MSKNKKVKFRITEVTEVNIDLGDIPPNLLRQIFEEGEGVVGESYWSWYDMADPQTISYMVELVD